MKFENRLIPNYTLEKSLRVSVLRRTVQSNVEANKTESIKIPICYNKHCTVPQIMEFILPKQIFRYENLMF